MEIIQELSKNQFKALACLEENAVRLYFSGKMDDQRPSSYMNPFLDAALEKAKASRLNLFVDLSGLDYMNSAGIAPLARLIEQIEGGGTMRISLLFDGRKLWQDIIFNALSVMSSDRVEFNRV